MDCIVHGGRKESDMTEQLSFPLSEQFCKVQREEKYWRFSGERRVGQEATRVIQLR